MSHAKTRLPVAVDLEAHMERRRREREWKARLAYLGGFASYYGRPPLSQHEENVKDYLADTITIQEYERREGERLAS